MVFWLSLVTVSGLLLSGFFVWQWLRSAPSLPAKTHHRVNEVTPSQTRLQVRDWMVEIHQQNQSRSRQARQLRNAAFEKRQGA